VGESTETCELLQSEGIHTSMIVADILRIQETHQVAGRYASSLVCQPKHGSCGTGGHTRS